MAILAKLSVSPVSVTKALVNKQIVSHKRLKTMTKPRCVSFDEKQNEAYENHTWCREESHLSWYSAEELHTIKEKCHTLARQIYKSEKNFVEMQTSYRNVLIRVYDACCQTPSEQKEPTITQQDTMLLQKIITKSNTRTGLERVCIRQIAHDRRFRRGQVVDAVLGIQACKSGSERAKTELTRMSSECVSRASRRFARFMALALEASIRQA